MLRIVFDLLAHVAQMNVHDARRMEEVRSASLPWLVVETGGEVRGYAYATPWRTRVGYRFSSEITVYLAAENHNTLVLVAAELGHVK